MISLESSNLKISMITKQQRFNNINHRWSGADGIGIASCNNNNNINNENNRSRRNSNNSSLSQHSNRVMHTILLMLMVLLFVTISVATGDLAEPPDCTGIICDVRCPFDSELVRIDTDEGPTAAPPPALNESLHSSQQPIENTVTPGDLIGSSERILLGSKKKRAVPMSRRRESIKIVPGGYIRRKRDVDNSASIPLKPSSNYQTVDEERVKECCRTGRVQCKCNFAKCIEPECAPHEYKTLIQSGSRSPGNCCSKFVCSIQKPSCYSQNLRQHFAANEKWDEDACTHCECSENGESNCQTSVCKAINCEKRLIVPGECCPVCDISDSKYCDGHEDCDLHCRNGFEIDPIRGCTICRCAKATTTTTSTTMSSIDSSTANSYNYSSISTTNAPSTTALTTSSFSTTEGVTKIEHQVLDNTTASSTTTVDEPPNSWFVHMPIILGICITIAAFAIIISLTCRHISHNKDKHRLNNKKNNTTTPLI